MHTSDYYREYYRKNKKKLKAYYAKWQKDNADILKEKRKNWRKRSSRYKTTHKLYFKKRMLNPVESKKQEARGKLYQALLKGKVIKRDCEVCGNEKSEGHHDDYNKPYEVRWLCTKHHKEHHKKLKSK